MTHLIKDIKIPTIIIARTKVGTINHTMMTVHICKKYKIPIKGIILNDFDFGGYKIKELTRDLKNLLEVPIIGVIPFIDNISNASLYKIFKKNLNLKLLLS